MNLARKIKTESAGISVNLPIVVNRIIDIFLRKTNAKNGIHRWRSSINGMKEAEYFLGNVFPVRPDSATHL